MIQNDDKALSLYKKTDWGQRYRYWRIGVAAILIFASGLKLHWLTASPLKVGFLLSDHLFYVLTVYLELVFASLLLANSWPILTHWLTIALFATFAFFTGRQVFHGESTCGCFGVVSVSPAIAFLLDCFIVSGFVGFRENEVKETKPKARTVSRFCACVLSVIGSGIVCLSSIYSWRIAHADDSFRYRNAGISLKQGDFVSLTPENWIGNLVPVVESLRHPERIQPECHIVFYRESCSECEHLLRTFVQEETLVYAESNLVFVELDGREPPAYLVSMCSGIDACDFTYLEPQFRWLLDPPVLVHVSNGRVVEVRRFK
jgi:hypothetical protein